MAKAVFRAVVAVTAFLAGSAVFARDTTPAKVLFSRAALPTDQQPRSIGFYSRGCLAGGQALPIDGPDWQVMRLSRNRNWGMPELVSYIETLAKDAHDLGGWPGLLVGDMSMPRGGPMPTGHASHQIGLDVDIWLTPMPDHTLSRDDRETMAARSLIYPGSNTKLNQDLWTDDFLKLIRQAASYDEVERIFVNAGIKQKLCQTAGRDRAWLRKVRPWYQHDEHFHVRLACPPGVAGCKAQPPPPEGDGCGSDLAWWLSPAPYRPAPKPTRPTKPPPEITLADLPAECADLLTEPAADMAGGNAASAPEPAMQPDNQPAVAASPGGSMPLPTIRPNVN